MNEIIKVNEDTMTVSARDLHEALGIRERFSLWADRQLQYWEDEWTSVGKPTEVNNNGGIQTIGFARRFATYKRAVLIFERFNEIVKLVKDPVRPVQFIFAGKAHPRDDEGKRYIQNIIHQSKYSELAGRLVFLENYDVHVARQMVSGCDVWLNNPRRPLEASGTSGQKTCVNGCLNLSILDGWWREGYDGTNGFAIGEDSNPDDVKEQDRIDSENLFRTLTEQVVPEFFDRSANGIPKLWIKRIRRNFATLPGQFNTNRMVREYVQKYYLSGEK